VLVDDRRFPVSAVYRNSQRICDSIRAATLAQAVGFIDARPALRAAAAGRPLHGPRDWNHLNEEGYRLLAGLLARRIDARPDDACEDWAGP
jgi:hypothetical protein